jgi:tryptophan synthase beta chain
MAPGFHAGGLCYHGMAPQISHLTKLGYIDPRSYNPRKKTTA